jgi:hypothetical protein
VAWHEAGDVAPPPSQVADSMCGTHSVCHHACVLHMSPLDPPLSGTAEDIQEPKTEERNRGGAIGVASAALSPSNHVSDLEIDPVSDLEIDRGGQRRQGGIGSSAGKGWAGVGLQPKIMKPKIPGSLRCLVAEAVREFHMIGEGDKVLVGLSGGKDSLTMLHVLLELKRRSPVKFDLAAATVDPQTPEYDPWPLVPYLEQLGVRYHMLSKPIIEMAKTSMDPKAGILKCLCLGVFTI